MPKQISRKRDLYYSTIPVSKISLIWLDKRILWYSKDRWMGFFLWGLY